MNDPFSADEIDPLPTRTKSALRPRRLAVVIILLVAIAFALPAAIPWLVVIAGFAVANEAKRIDPATTAGSLAAIAIMATATALVLTGPWIGANAENEESRVLDYVRLPHAQLLGGSRSDAVIAWLLVVAFGGWLTYARESLWVQLGVLLFSLAPWSVLLLHAWALRNA